MRGSHSDAAADAGLGDAERLSCREVCTVPYSVRCAGVGVFRCQNRAVISPQRHDETALSGCQVSKDVMKSVNRR